MTDRTGCDALQDWLDGPESRVSGPGVRQELPEELRRHAAECGECAALLRMRDLLDLPSADELEAAVPEPHVRGMWSAVRDALPDGASVRDLRASRRSGWLVPGLAAASVVLAVVAGGLAFERGRLLERQAELSDRLAGQERRLAALETSGAAAGPGAVALLGVPAWERALAAEETITLGRVRELLEALPPGTTLLDRSELEAVASARPASPLRLTAARPEIGDAIDVTDGLQAGELLTALRALDLADATRIPATRVLDIYRAAQRSARS
jgi:hypothetical protein